MKVLLSRPVASIVLVHDRARNKLNSISERTSPVTVHRTATVVSHRIARLMDYATVHGTFTVRSL